jgi:LmbE family N-acetylglucosaminyl deacetylase
VDRVQNPGARPPGAHRRSVGVPSVFITTALDVRPVIGEKRAALAAHQSQVAETSWALTMPDPTFAEVYGYEFYVRRGPAGPIDQLT